VSVVEEAQQTRGYALAMLLISLSTLCLVIGMRDKRMLAWWGYAIFGALAVYAHLYALLVLVATALPFFVLPKSVVPWRRVVLAWLVLGLMLSPEFVFLVHARTDQINWIGGSQDGAILRTINFLSGDAGAILRTAALGCLIVVACSCWRRTVLFGRGDASWRSLIVLSWAIVPSTLAVVIGVWRPILVYRYLLVSVPAWILIVAAALHLVTHRPLYRVAIATMVSLQLVALVAYERGHEIEPWRDVARVVAHDAKQGDGIAVLPGYQRMALEYYLSTSERPPAQVVAATPNRQWGTLPIYGGDDFPVSDGRTLHADVAAFDRVWLILDPADPATRAKEARIVRSGFAGFRLTDEYHFGRLVLRRYEARTDE
jgi:mannosyltransferase